MSSFTENLYLKLAIQKLQEENQQLLKLLNEVEISPPTPPAGNPPTTTPTPPSPFRPVKPGIPKPPARPAKPGIPKPRPLSNISRQGNTQRSAIQGGSQDTPPNKGPWWDPMYGRGAFGGGVPMLTPYPITMPLPVKTPAPMTMPYQQPFSLNRPYDPNDDPNNWRPTKGMGDGGI
jgi:hypothetical protein